MAGLIQHTSWFLCALWIVILLLKDQRWPEFLVSSVFGLHWSITFFKRLTLDCNPPLSAKEQKGDEDDQDSDKEEIIHESNGSGNTPSEPIQTTASLPVIATIKILIAILGGLGFNIEITGSEPVALSFLMAFILGLVILAGSLVFVLLHLYKMEPPYVMFSNFNTMLTY